jgi:hypothetical protein
MAHETPRIRRTRPLDDPIVAMDGDRSKSTKPARTPEAIVAIALVIFYGVIKWIGTIPYQ